MLGHGSRIMDFFFNGDHDVDRVPAGDPRKEEEVGLREAAVTDRMGHEESP